MIYLATIFFSWLISQVFLKILVSSLKDGKLRLKVVLYPGGMPSAHSAVVSSVTALVALLEGFNGLFYVSLVFSIMVIYDALVTRNLIGLNAHELKLITKKELKEKVGHKPLEVLAGVAIGILSAYLGTFFFG